MALSGASVTHVVARALWVGAAVGVSVLAVLLLRPAPHVPAVSQHQQAVKPQAVKTALVRKSVSQFTVEESLTVSQRMARWDALIAEASAKFAIPADWIRDVMRAESGGRTMLAENTPIESDMGAQGLMQLLPGTYAEMRAQYGLGANVFDPRDNIFAGAAYLKWLKGKYGFPGMFAAYNDGPGLFEQHMFKGRPLPDETKLYVAGITKRLGKGTEWLETHDQITVTRPDGSKLALARGAVRSVRAALPGEYAPGVLAVVDLGRARQGVLESPDKLIAALGPQPKGTRLALSH